MQTKIPRNGRVGTVDHSCVGTMSDSYLVHMIALERDTWMIKPRRVREVPTIAVPMIRQQCILYSKSPPVV